MSALQKYHKQYCAIRKREAAEAAIRKEDNRLFNMKLYAGLAVFTGVCVLFAPWLFGTFLTYLAVVFGICVGDMMVHGNPLKERRLAKERYQEAQEVLVEIEYKKAKQDLDRMWDGLEMTAQEEEEEELVARRKIKK